MLLGSLIHKTARGVGLVVGLALSSSCLPSTLHLTEGGPEAKQSIFFFTPLLASRKCKNPRLALSSSEKQHTIKLDAFARRFERF